MKRLVSISAIGLTALLSGAPPLRAQEMVDPRSGLLELTVTDVVVPGGATQLEVSRALQTESRAPGLLGTRWRLNWEVRLVQALPLIFLEDMAGSVAFKPAGAPLTYASDTGDRLVFERDGRSVRTRLDGRRELFDAQGRLIQRDDRNGNGVALRYGADGRLSRIEGPRGAVVQLVTERTGRLTGVQTSTGATVSYAYANDALSEVQVNGRPPVRYAYQTSGELVRVEDPQSGPVEFAYDARKRVVSRRWADGSQERYEYEDAANRQRYVDPTGAVTVTQWSQDGRRAEVTDPLGGKTVISYGAAGRPESVTGATGMTARTAYDALGRTVAVQDPRGRLTRFEYLGTTSWPKTVTHPDGTRESLEYDAQLNLTAVKVGAQTVAAFAYHPDGTLRSEQAVGVPEQRVSYDAQGRPQIVANALGQRVQIAYDARGNPVREVNPLGGVTARQWDAQDRLVSETDPVGGTTRYEYDVRGRLTRSIDPAGAVTQYQYDARGRLIAETDPAGQVTRYEYDPAGRLVRGTDAGGSDSFRYDAAGNLTEWTDRLGRSVQYERDPLGRLTRERRWSGHEVRYRYDALGELLAIEDSSGTKQELQRDERGRITATRDALGATQQYQYDALGNFVAFRDARGQVKQFAYTAQGALAGVRERSGDAAEYRYDAAGRLVGIVRPSGGASRLAYDGLGNVVQEVDPLGQQRRSVYDTAGRLVASTDGAGRVTRYSYDGIGRLVEKQRPDGKRITYRYDAVGNLLEATDGAFPVRYQYDPAGRLLRAEYPALKKAVGYEYDAQGLRTKLIDPEGRVTRYEYNGQRQLVAIIPPDGKPIALSYDTRERLQAVQYPNGLVGRWDYDGAGRVAKVSHVDASGTPAEAWTYGYDPDGHLLQHQDGQGRLTRFSYDPAGQLAEAAGPAGVVRYRYARGGNRATVEEGGAVTQYRHDQADRLIQAGAEQLAYDANGNLTRRQGPRGTTTYEYDAEDRLVRVRLPDGAPTTFGYAPTGERVWKQDAEGVTYYLYDGLDLIQELDDKGNTKAAYVHGPGIDQPLGMLREGQSYYYHADRLGNVRLLTDGGGQIAATYEYDAFGRIRAKGAVANPFTFTGRQWDAGTGLYYYRARYYDPSLGRFVSPDPKPPDLVEPTTLNPYIYAGNDPVNFVDPMGGSKLRSRSLQKLGQVLGKTGPRPEVTPPRPWKQPPPREGGERRVSKAGSSKVTRTELPDPLPPPTDIEDEERLIAEALRKALTESKRGKTFQEKLRQALARGLEKLGPLGRKIQDKLGLAGLILAALQIATSENPAEAAQQAAAVLAGGIVGGAVGAPFGPAGVLIGGYVGSQIPDWLAALDNLVSGLLSGPPGPSLFFPPERVTDPTRSQPATGSTPGTVQVTPKPPATMCAAVVSSVEAGLTKARSLAAKLRDSETAAQAVDKWSTAFPQTPAVPGLPGTSLPRIDCRPVVSAVDRIAQKMGELRQAQARLAQQRSAATAAAGAACKLVTGDGGQPAPATLDATARAQVSQLVGQARTAAAETKKAGEPIKRLIREIRAEAARIEEPLKGLALLQQRASQAQAAAAPLLAEEPAVLQALSDIRSAIQSAEGSAGDVQKQVTAEAGRLGPCLATPDGQRVWGQLSAASQQSTAAVTGLKSREARLQAALNTIDRAKRQANELGRLVCPLNLEGLRGLDQLTYAEQEAGRAAEAAARAAAQAATCAGTLPALPSPGTAQQPTTPQPRPGTAQQPTTPKPPQAAERPLTCYEQCMKRCKARGGPPGTGALFDVSERLCPPYCSGEGCKGGVPQN